jgi:hypothetical protein
MCSLNARRTLRQASPSSIGTTDPESSGPGLEFHVQKVSSARDMGSLANPYRVKRSRSENVGGPPEASSIS